MVIFCGPTPWPFFHHFFIRRFTPKRMPRKPPVWPIPWGSKRASKPWNRPTWRPWVLNGRTELMALLTQIFGIFGHFLSELQLPVEKTCWSLAVTYKQLPAVPSPTLTRNSEIFDRSRGKRQLKTRRWGRNGGYHHPMAAMATIRGRHA